MDKKQVVYNRNQSTDFLVSPADGSVSVKWLLDGEVIGTAPTLSYTFTQTGSFKLRFEAVRNGTTNFREFTLVVTAP